MQQRLKFTYLCDSSWNGVPSSLVNNAFHSTTNQKKWFVAKRPSLIYKPYLCKLINHRQSLPTLRPDHSVWIWCLVLLDENNDYFCSAEKFRKGTNSV
jgi:hypothetical protein